MKQLPKSFEQNGFTFTQLAREGQVALYKRQSKSFTYQDYEIIRVCFHNEYLKQIDSQEDNTIPASEVYPSPNMWGEYAITKIAEKEALEEFFKWSAKFSKLEPTEFFPLNETKSKRGRKPLQIDLAFPDTEWTVKEMADKHKVSTGYINVHIKPFLKSGEITMVCARKTTPGRGKSTNYYKFEGFKTSKTDYKKVSEKS